MGETGLEEEEEFDNSTNAQAIPEEVQRLFDAWDADGNGFLDVEELSAGMEASGMSRKVARRIMKAGDLNGDGQLDAEEFSLFLVSKSCPKQFKDLCNLSADLRIDGGRFGVGISWDKEGTTVDVDLQAVAFNADGRCVDAVFFNNLKACGKGLTHSGDEEDGSKAGMDEVVWANVDRLKNIKLVVFVVAAHHGGSLCDVSEGFLHLLRDGNGNELAKMPFEGSDEEVDMVGALVREDDGGWTFRPLAFPAQDGQHFMDILEPTIGNYVRRIIPGAPTPVTAKFDVKKAGVVDFPRLDAIQVALGWDARGNIDLDVTAVLFDSEHTCKDACFYGNLETSGLKHSGDNLTGEGDGDDEVITVRLNDVPDEIVQVMFMICIYTRNKNFESVDSSYCRVIAEGNELCKFTVDGTPDEESDPEGEIDVEPDKEGLIIARLYREQAGGRWAFQACPTPIDGRTYKEAMPQLEQMARLTPKAYAKAHN